MASTSRCSVVAALLQDNGVSLTRRSVLGAIVAVSLAGCRPRRSSRPAVASGDLARIDRAVDGERALLARYDAAIAALDAVAAGRLTRARDRHAAHLRALTEAGRRPTHTPPPPAPPPSAGPSVATDRAALATVLKASAADLRATAVRVDSGPLAALLASVAAEHAADGVVEGAAS
jgi:hypothetical protein